MFTTYKLQNWTRR